MKILLIGLFLIFSCQKSSQNQLNKAGSGFLASYAEDPINWRLWNKASFQEAQTTDRPIFLSIGHSHCLACQEMKIKALQDKKISKLLNQHFIPILVDRRARPDIDQIYIQSLQAMGAPGGWPLTMFLTPEGKAFWGATYYSPEKLHEVLSTLKDNWQNRKQKILEQANLIAQNVVKSQDPTITSNRPKVEPSIIITAFEGLQDVFDGKSGGFTHPPKFPATTKLNFLLESKDQLKKSSKKDAHRMVEITLNSMWHGSFYDHLAGGFFRYSKDASWLDPLLEKPLPQNALLSHLYFKSYKETRDLIHLKIARESLGHLLKAYKSTKFGYAASVHFESDHYKWNQTQIEQVLKKDSDSFLQVFSLKNGLLNLSKAANPKDSYSTAYESMKQKLLAAREKRSKQTKDNLVITAWNALLVSTLTEAYAVVKNKGYLERAIKIVRDLYFHYKTDQLLRYKIDDQHKERAQLDDYAYLIQALLDLYKVTYDPTWYLKAKELQSELDLKLWSFEYGAYFQAQKDPLLIKQTVEFYDGPLPSPNAVALTNLVRLYHYSMKGDYIQKANLLVQAMSRSINRHPPAFTQALMAVALKDLPAKKIIVVTPHKLDIEGEKITHFLMTRPGPRLFVVKSPEHLLKDAPEMARGKKLMKGQTTVYLCDQNNECQYLGANLKSVRKSIF